jgi:hypothetical protein
VILAACRAVAPRGELLTCMSGCCTHCGADACAIHDRCLGCGLVICGACDTEGGMMPLAFPGDRQPHPHNRVSP